MPHLDNVQPSLRPQTILMPNNAWGGDGCIGCDIGLAHFLVESGIFVEILVILVKSDPCDPCDRHPE